MQHHHPKEKASSFNKSKHKTVELKGAIELEYHLVSSQELHELKEYSDSSSKFDYSLFLFGLSFAMIITLLSFDIKSNLMIAIILIGSASITFSVGVFCYLLHRKGKKRISQLVEIIKRTKCTLL